MAMLLKHRISQAWQSSTKRVMLLTFIGLLFSFLMDIMLAARLGTNETTDAYIVAITLPILIDTVTREGTLSSMTPLLVEKRTNLERNEFQNFASGLFNLGLVTGIFLTAIIEVFAPGIILATAPGLSPAGKAEAVDVLRLCAPLIIFTPAITVMSVLLNSQKQFTLVALRNTIAPATVVVLMLLTWNTENITSWMAVGYCLGFAIFFAILFLKIQNTQFKHQWSQWISQKDLIVLYKTISFPTLGFVLRQSLRLIERSIASVTAVGGVASYYFAFRICSATQTLIGSSIATTGLPMMAEHSLAGNNSKLLKIMRQNAVKTLILTAPAVLTIVLFNKPLIALVYGRGVFNSDAIAQTARVFLWLGIGLGFYCIIPILQSGLYAQKRYGLVFRNMVIATIANVVFAYILSNLVGLAGLAIAVLVSTLISVSNLSYLNYKLLKK